MDEAPLVCKLPFSMRALLKQSRGHHMLQFLTENGKPLYACICCGGYVVKRIGTRLMGPCGRTS
eukprot:8258686-Prorocentrum_lima.AAC.1